MKLYDMIEAEASWNDVMKRLSNATYSGNSKDLSEAVHDADYCSQFILESFNCTPKELTEQLKAWRKL